MKLTDKVIRDLIVEVMTESDKPTILKAQSDIKTFLDNYTKDNPNASLMQAFKAVKAAGLNHGGYSTEDGSDTIPTALNYVKNYKDWPKKIKSTSEPETETDEVNPDEPDTSTDEVNPDEPDTSTDPDLADDSEYIPAQIPSSMLSLDQFYTTTSPIFRFDLFTGSDYSEKDITNENPTQLSEILKNAHKRLINDKTTGGAIEALKFLHQLFRDPAVALNRVGDLDGDTNLVDDQISTFFSMYAFFSFLEKITLMNQTSMGFALENWLALVLGGQAMSAGASGNAYDLYDSDGSQWSLKFYLPTGAISQKAEIEAAKEYKYIIAVKDKKNPTKIDFYTTTIEGVRLSSGVPVKEIMKTGNKVCEIDLVDFRAKINEIKKKESTAGANNIIKHIDIFGTYIDQLKIFLSYWFLQMKQNPDDDKISEAANGVKRSSENCIFSLNSIASASLSLDAPEIVKGEEYNSQMKSILSKYSSLVNTMELPDIRIDQIHSQTINNELIKDFILDQVGDLLQTNEEDLLSEFVSKILRVEQVFKNYEEKLASEKLSIAECFAALIVVDSFKYLYDLREVSKKAGEAIGGGPAAATAGFIFENFVSVLGSSPGEVGMKSYSLGGNDQKLDFCLVKKIEENKYKMIGFSSKSSGVKQTPFSPMYGAGKYIFQSGGGPEAIKKQLKIWEQFPGLLQGVRDFFKFDSTVSTIEDPKKLFIHLFNTYGKKQKKFSKDVPKNDAAKLYMRFKKFFEDEYRSLRDVGKSNVVWIEAVKKHCEDAGGPEGMMQAVEAVITKAKEIADEKEYQHSLGRLFGGAPRQLKVYNYLEKTSEYKEYKEKLETYYDLSIAMLGSPLSGVEGENYTEISVAVGPETGFNTADFDADQGKTGEFKPGFKVSSLKLADYESLIDKIKESLNNQKNNFLVAFEEFNEFKISSAKFLDSPDQNSWNISYTNYDNFRALANKLFKSQNIETQIAEVITASMLQKLISESFKK
jgi:hypothetical protein